MGDLIFTVAYGGGLIVIGLFSKFMIRRMSLKSFSKKDEQVKELI